jgi:hypothetical protein
MVCYNSKSPLPSSASILCSAAYASILCSLSSSAQRTYVHLLFCLYALCCLCILYTTPLISTSGTTPLRLLLPTCITIEEAHSVLCFACISHVESSARSSCKLFIFSGRYSRFFGFSGSYPENLLLLCQSKFFVFSGSYSESFFLASLASKSLPSCDLWQ